MLSLVRTTSSWPSAARTAAQRGHDATPATRNRVVDHVRAAAIAVVVLGHWTIAAVQQSPGGGAQVSAHAVLDVASWTHPITWLAQVMPLFFVVGGYSNALSWRSARAASPGTTAYPAWLRTRLRRLALPIVPLLVVWTLAAGAALALGVQPDTLRRASQVALIPTWFLAAYVLVVAATPPCLSLWERYGLRAVIGVLLAGALFDAVSIAAGNELLGYPNYLLVWSSVHMLGFAWLDGQLAGGRRFALAVIGWPGWSRSSPSAPIRSP